MISVMLREWSGRRKFWNQDIVARRGGGAIAVRIKLAQAEGIPLNKLINVAVAEKLSALRTESYFAERARRASVPTALKILKRAGAGRPPMKGDEMGGRRKRR
jgi:hypothetical protein